MKRTAHSWRTLLAVLVSVAGATSCLAEPLSGTPEEFLQRLNAILDGAGGGVAMAAKMGRCSSGEVSACQFSGFDGRVTGLLRTETDSPLLAEVTVGTGPANSENGYFFAAVAATLSVLAASATEDARREAMIDMVGTITTKDGVVKKRVGGVTMTVDAIAQVGLIAQFSAAK